MSTTPIIKWAGGKRQIMKTLLSHFPSPDSYHQYHEPFFGAGSVMMELLNSNQIQSKNIYISDILEPLMLMYHVIKLYPEELIAELSLDKYENTLESFTKNKERFNELKKTIKLVSIGSKIELSALFIYLNRIGFNGMYRENKKGEYNIPFGKQKNPKICNHDAIRNLSTTFRNLNIYINCNSYMDSMKYIETNDFVYLDPPYYGTFTGYSKYNFDKQEQIKLRDFYLSLTEKGCKVALSNSDDPFIIELYQNIPNIKIIKIEVKRVINSKAEERKNAKFELLIINY